MFDSHCHLSDDRFAGAVAETVARARAAGIHGMVTVASAVPDARRVATLTEEFPDLWGTAGVHPHEAAGATLEDLTALRDLSSHPRVVAIGEAGLDYHYDHSPRPAQRSWFGRQLDLAAELGLPIVVHSRDADEDTAALIREYAARVRGVLHCFTGGDALLEAALEADWYLSFAGLITFRNFRGEARLRRVPGERILVETDSPYLAPVPHRGKRNEPAFVAEVCAAAARLRGVPLEAFAVQTEDNARRFYGLGPAG